MTLNPQKLYTAFLQWNLCHEAQHGNKLDYCPLPVNGGGLTACVARSIKHIMGWIRQNTGRPFFVCLQEVWLDSEYSFLRALYHTAPPELGMVWTTVGRNTLLPMPILYNKAFHAPRFVSPSQWSTMDGGGTAVVYTSLNPLGSGSLGPGRPYVAILFGGVRSTIRDWVVTNVHAPHGMTSDTIINAMENGALDEYRNEIIHGEASIAVLGDFNAGYRQGSTVQLMGRRSVNDYQARGASCCWNLRTRDRNSRHMNSRDGSSMYDQIWIFDHKGYWKAPMYLRTLDWADEPIDAFTSDHRPVEAYISAVVSE